MKLPRIVGDVLIKTIGTSYYLRIPRRIRFSLGLPCGEDFSDINRLLKEIMAAAKSKGVAR